MVQSFSKNRYRPDIACHNMYGPFIKSYARGHEANELEAFMTLIKDRELEPISYFYHVTSNSELNDILQTGKIESVKTESPDWTFLARDKMAPAGTLLSASLYHSEIPDTSFYGENRLKIPCGFILSSMQYPRLYLETFYHFDANPKNQIVRLLLVDAGKYPRETDWCERKCLRRLNILNNQILVLDKNKLVYKCIKNDGKTFPYIWVDVLVVGDVDMVSVDTVEEVIPSREEATPGTVPPLL